MSFKSRKYKSPFTGKKKFSSFEEALQSAILLPEIKKKVKRGETVHLYLVNGLANSSYIKEVFVNADTINRYKPSDLEEQIGYMLSKEDIERMKNNWRRDFDPHKDIYDRNFITDIGINPRGRHNKHLAFTSKRDANMYLEYMFTSKEEQKERDAYLAGCDEFDSMFPPYEDYPYEEDTYYHENEE